MSVMLTSLLDAAPRLSTETIATGRNRIFLCYMCLQLPRQATTAGAAVKRGKHCPLPKHAIVKVLLLLLELLFVGVCTVFAHAY